MRVPIYFRQRLSQSQLIIQFLLRHIFGSASIIITNQPTIVHSYHKEMEPQLNNIQIHACSAFKRTIEPQGLITQAVAELEAYAQQVLSMRKKINLIQAVDYFDTVHPLTHVLIDLVFSLQNSLNSENQNPNQEYSTQKITQIPMSLFKNICTLLQQSLVTIDCKYGCELTLSMLFERGLVQTFKLCFIQSTLPSNKQPCKLSYLALDQVLVSLANQDYRQQFLKNIYILHSGSVLSIQRTTFTQNLKCVINNIGKTFTQKTNLITRNLKNVKKSKFINEIVTNSIKTICNYKNQQFIQQEVRRVTNCIFGPECSTLSKDKFFQKISSLLSSSVTNKQGYSVLYVVFLYVDLFRVETLMINDPELAVNIQKQKEINSSNFYTQEMQKLLKKCPYNGDECCDCKKCQCVRRNRQSAKLSQQKKRNAVEQLDPMKKRIDELERRNRQLEEENKILRGIVKELKSYEGIKSAFNSTIQSVSKVLDD